MNRRNFFTSIGLGGSVALSPGLLKKVKDIKKIDVKNDELLIVTLRDGLSRKQFDDIYDCFNESLHGKMETIIVPDGYIKKITKIKKNKGGLKRC